MPESATFDLVLLHYGNGEPLSCPHCKAVRGGCGKASCALVDGVDCLGIGPIGCLTHSIPTPCLRSFGPWAPSGSWCGS